METLNSLAGLLNRGKVTSRELVEQALARIAAPGGQGQLAFVSVDAEGARAAADYQDQLRRRHRAPSPFAGIPFSSKDLFDLAGEVTTAGSVVLRDAPPARRDAAAIAALKSAGLVVLGRTNMTEFAYSGVGLNPHYGTPLSVFERAVGRIPGGSSSGAAVSVADGMCALAIGSDTGGSCRIPAAYNGIVGYKPSRGRVSTAGAYPLSSTLDSIGPLARSVACCAAADALMSGDWSGAIATLPVSSLRLGVLNTYVLDGLDPEVGSAFSAALATLSRAGAAVIDVDFAELAELPALTTKGGLVAAEALAHHRARLAAHGERYDPRVSGRLRAAETINAADYISIMTRRQQLIDEFCQRCCGFSAILLPTVMNVPPPLSAFASDADYARLNGASLRNTYIGNFLNTCAISLPMTAAGTAPAGLMLMAPHGQDHSLFAVASAVEAALGSDFSRN
jgi:aspartyl-tRNA(Asn)/glutamyl-tRNA(Gln) amidotransferase subunit A